MYNYYEYEQGNTGNNKLLLTRSNCNLGINWPRFFQNCPNEVRAIWKNRGQFISPNCILSQLISVLLITIVQDFSIFRYFLSIILLHRGPQLSIPVSSKARRLVCLVYHLSKLCIWIVCADLWNREDFVLSNGNNSGCTSGQLCTIERSIGHNWAVNCEQKRLLERAIRDIISATVY